MDRTVIETQELGALSRPVLAVLRQVIRFLRQQGIKALLADNGESYALLLFTDDEPTPS